MEIRVTGMHPGFNGQGIPCRSNEVSRGEQDKIVTRPDGITSTEP
jgi:hypothetical protein